jgi:hypothetical protein
MWPQGEEEPELDANGLCNLFWSTYSTDDFYAMPVIEKMRSIGFPIIYYNDYVDDIHRVLFGPWDNGDPMKTEGWVSGKTFAHAVCLAALDTIGALK